MSPKSPFKGGDPSTVVVSGKNYQWLIDDTFRDRWLGLSHVSTYMTLLPREIRLMVGRHIDTDVYFKAHPASVTSVQ